MNKKQSLSFSAAVEVAIKMRNDGKSKQEVFMHMDFNMKKLFVENIDITDLIAIYPPTEELFVWILGSKIIEDAKRERQRKKL